MRTTRSASFGRVGPAAALLCIAVAPPLHAQREAPAELAVAESALARGDMNRAVDLAREYTGRHQDDWRGWFVQGEATLRRGGSDNAYRVAAVIAFRHATQLAPQRAEVWDGYGRAGLELGSADGELILHDAYERVAALDPLYPGAWSNWLKAYRSRSDRERMRRILGRHDSIPEVRAQMAQLLIEDEHYAAANAVLDSLIALDPRQPGWLALRAQSALESGDTTTGTVLYLRAVSHADRPGGELLWEQAIGIATPEEIRAWESAVSPGERPGFLRAFWARRDPDLFAETNERIAEHFARLRVVRREFPATHPLSSYKNRALSRELMARPSPAEQLFYLRCEAQEVPGGPLPGAELARLNPAVEALLRAAGTRSPWINAGGPADIGLLVMPYGRDIRDIDTTAAALGYNLRTGLDDRGLTWLRFGPPRRRTMGTPNATDPSCARLHLDLDLEHWDYDDIGTVRFFRPVGLTSSSSTGERVYRPMNDAQFEGMRLAMTRNGTSVPAPLRFGVWTAQFRGVDSGTTDVVVVTTRGAAAAQLVGALGQTGPPTEDSLGVVVLSAQPGWYVLTTNSKVADTLGRQSQRVSVQPLGAGRDVSDMVLAQAWPDTLTTRQVMLRRLQRDLTFPAGGTLRAYAEIYGFDPSPDGVVRYVASYQIYPTSDPARDAQREDLVGGVRLTYERQRRSPGGPIGEWLNIMPSQTPPGRYLLRLEVLEPGGTRVIGRSQIAFQIGRP
jgi:Tfp pilus assembly protein PilF